MKILFSSTVRGATVPTREKRGDRIERRIVSGAYRASAASSVGKVKASCASLLD